MRLEGEVKRRFSERMLAMFAERFEVLTMGERCCRLEDQELTTRTWKASGG
ncbi:MAG: hypothetical protein R3C05_25245 [Pirellulaceae bacterium]